MEPTFRDYFTKLRHDANAHVWSNWLFAIAFIAGLIAAVALPWSHGPGTVATAILIVVLLCIVVLQATMLRSNLEFLREVTAQLENLLKDNP